MVVDGSAFIKRAHIFFEELQKDSFPNASTLAKLCACSKNTAQRVIYRLRDEYLLPIQYDDSRKGYRVPSDYVFPQLLPPGKDELTALLLARSLTESLDAKDLDESLARLWSTFTLNNPAVRRELRPLGEVFSSDLTAVGAIADTGILSYVNAASSGESVRVNYRSPWRHEAPKTFEGRILKVHYCDGCLYLLFRVKTGNEIVLNASFIKEFTILAEHLPCVPAADGVRITADNWLEGFGIWSGDQLQQIEVHIRAPASLYHASQRWHEDQEDSWGDNELLIRRLPAVISPEIVRRILSLGEFVEDVQPKALKDAVREQAQELVSRLAP